MARKGEAKAKNRLKRETQHQQEREIGRERVSECVKEEEVEKAAGDEGQSGRRTWFLSSPVSFPVYKCTVFPVESAAVVCCRPGKNSLFT